MTKHSAATLLLLMAITGVGADIGIIARLEKWHPSLYSDMGSPKFGDSNLSNTMWRLQKFLWSLAFLRLRDYLLTALCVYAMLTELGMAYFFFAGM